MESGTYLGAKIWYDTSGLSRHRTERPWEKFPYIHHVRPLGCRMLYHTGVHRLLTFKPRLQESVHIGHTGGGIYKVLTVDGVAQTKRVRAFEKHSQEQDAFGRVAKKTIKGLPQERFIMQTCQTQVA